MAINLGTDPDDDDFESIPDQSDDDGSALDYSDLARSEGPQLPAAPGSTIARPSDSIQTGQAAPINPAVVAYLTAKRGPASDGTDWNAKLDQAQQQQKQNELGTGIAAALTQLGHGLSRSAGPADMSGIRAISANDQQPVQNVLTAQKVAQSDAEASRQADQYDPDSISSQNARALVQAQMPKLAGAYGDKFSQVTAADLPNIVKVNDVLAAIDARKDIAQDRLQMSQAMRQSSVDSRQDKLDTKNQADHDKYLQHIEDAERGWRSDPATTRFDSNLAAVSTGDAILAKYRGNEDAMPIQDIHSLVADKLRAQTGSAPTEQEITAQMPHNLGTLGGGVKSFFTRSPEPANSGDFVRAIDKYFKDVEAKSLAGVNNRQQTVASDPRLTPDERARVVKIGVPQPVYAANGGQSSAPQSYSPDVVSYASQHGITPAQAQAIKNQRTGGQ